MGLHPDRRGAARIDKVFRVLLSTEAGDERWVLGRNISSTGMFAETSVPIPLRTKVILRFRPSFDGPTDASICAIARVQNHYCWQYSDGHQLRALNGIGLRFLRFIAEASSPALAEHMH